MKAALIYNRIGRTALLQSYLCLEEGAEKLERIEKESKRKPAERTGKSAKRKAGKTTTIITSKIIGYTRSAQQSFYL